MAGALVALSQGGLGNATTAPLHAATAGNSVAPIAAATSTAAKAPASTPAASTTSSSSSSSSNPYNINQPQLLSGLQQEYGSTIANAEQQVPEYQAIQNNATANANTQAQQQTSDENNNFTAANNAYNTQNQATQSQQQLSLAELADQIHGQNQGLTNQLGTMGAGSSSAVGTGQQALAKVQNTDRANIQEQAGAGTAEIQAAQQSLLTQHQSNLDQIQQYKTNQLANISATYGPLIQNVETQIGTASGEERARLAEYDVTLQQQAGTALQQLDATVSQLANATVAKSNEALSALTVNAAPTAVTAPTVSPFNVGNSGTTANTTASAAPSGGSVYDLMQQNAPTTP